MTRKEIIELIIDGRETFKNKRPIHRNIIFDFELSRKLKKVITISGVRRAGKSMYLKQISEQLNLNPDQIVFLDFSETILSDFTTEDFRALPTQYMELRPELEPVFFFDEIQEIPDFEKGLRYLQNKDYQIFITGSSAQLFSSDIASRLRGKTAEIRLFPLDFPEFLKFRQFEEKPGYTQAEKARLAVLTDEFLKWGGFPEVVLTENIETRRYLLKGYLDTMLLRDVIEKNKIQNVPIIDKLLTKIIGSFTRNISINKWYNDFKSSGFKVSKDTLYNYLGYLKDTGFIHTIIEYGKASGSTQKVFLVDNGLYEARRSINSDIGKLLENAVFGNLLRNQKKITFWNDGKHEIDFVTEHRLIQACYQLNSQNINRETSAFSAFNRKNNTALKPDLVVMESDVDNDSAVSFYDWIIRRNQL